MKRYRILAAFVACLVLAFVAWSNTAVVPTASAQEEVAHRNIAPKLEFDRIGVREDGKLGSHTLRRAKIPGGWLVSIDTGNRPDPSVGITFVPDSDHVWDGKSLP